MSPFSNMAAMAAAVLFVIICVVATARQCLMMWMVPPVAMYAATKTDHMHDHTTLTTLKIIFRCFEILLSKLLNPQ